MWNAGNAQLRVGILEFSSLMANSPCCLAALKISVIFMSWHGSSSDSSSSQIWWPNVNRRKKNPHIFLWMASESGDSFCHNNNRRFLLVHRMKFTFTGRQMGVCVWLSSAKRDVRLVRDVARVHDGSSVVVEAKKKKFVTRTTHNEQWRIIINIEQTFFSRCCQWWRWGFFVVCYFCGGGRRGRQKFCTESFATLSLSRATFFCLFLSPYYDKLKNY